MPRWKDRDGAAYPPEWQHDFPLPWRVMRLADRTVGAHLDQRYPMQLTRFVDSFQILRYHVVAHQGRGQCEFLRRGK